MAVITQAVLAEAAIAVDAMGLAEQAQLADEVFAHQPNLLASVLVLQRMGVSLPQMDVPIHILLVAYQAMKTSGHTWPVISEDTQESCLRRLTRRIRSTHGSGRVAGRCNERSSTTSTSIESPTCLRSRTATWRRTICSGSGPTQRSPCCSPRSISWSASPTLPCRGTSPVL